MNSIRHSRLLTWTISLLAVVSTTSQSIADEINILVPAYANPCCGDGTTMWAELVDTANDSGKNFGLHLIFNPASGPGTSRDGNYLDSTGNGPLADARSAGAKIHGYVATGFGDRSIAEVKSEIDQYLTNPDLYQGFVDGIFFDEMSNDLADVGYYQELAAYVDTQSNGALTFGNPGTSFVNNPSNQSTFTSGDYAEVFDTLMTFENTGVEYVDNYTAPEFLDAKDASGFAHAIHTQSDWNPAILELASERKVGYLYVTDDVFLDAADNPWDSLTSYWSDFTNDVSQFNAVPEPTSTVSMMAVFVIGATRRRRQRA